jgi:predicted ATPase
LCPDCADEVYPFLGQMMSLPLSPDAEARLEGVEGEGLKVLTFRAVHTLLNRAARDVPLVIVCEDLHWADPTSLELLEQLLPLTDRVPLLLICVFRPVTDRGCWRIKQIATQSYRHRHTELWLEPLSPTESANLVVNLLQAEDLSQGLRTRILGHAEGNPFYMEEILRSLIDEGILVHDEATRRWGAAREVADIPVPDTLRGVLMARIDRLPEPARQVLQAASVVGRIFGRRVLESVVQGERGLDDDLVTHLVVLERAQMVRQRARLPEAEYIFKHQLTLEAAYEGLLRRQRRDLHRRAAQALERLCAERAEERLGLLGHHWERAGYAERAVDYLRRAGEQAATRFANAEAVSHFSRALDLTPEEDLEGRYALRAKPITPPGRRTMAPRRPPREPRSAVPRVPKTWPVKPRRIASLGGRSDTLGAKNRGPWLRQSSSKPSIWRTRLVCTTSRQMRCTTWARCMRGVGISTSKGSALKHNCGSVARRGIVRARG